MINVETSISENLSCLAKISQLVNNMCSQQACSKLVNKLNAVTLSSCYKVVTYNLSTRCVRNRLVASLSTSCNNAVILSSCYKVVTYNLSTRCVRNRLVASLSTSCNNAVIVSSCYKVVTHNLLTRCVRKQACSKLVSKL
jgi:hypothetical protein